MCKSPYITTPATITVLCLSWKSVNPFTPFKWWFVLSLPPRHRPCNLCLYRSHSHHRATPICFINQEKQIIKFMGKLKENWVCKLFDLTESFYARAVLCPHDSSQSLLAKCSAESWRFFSHRNYNYPPIQHNRKRFPCRNRWIKKYSSNHTLKSARLNAHIFVLSEWKNNTNYHTLL